MMAIHGSGGLDLCAVIRHSRQARGIGSSPGPCAGVTLLAASRSRPDRGSATVLGGESHGSVLSEDVGGIDSGGHQTRDPPTRSRKEDTRDHCGEKQPRSKRGRSVCAKRPDGLHCRRDPGSDTRAQQTAEDPADQTLGKGLRQEHD